MFKDFADLIGKSGLLSYDNLKKLGIFAGGVISGGIVMREIKEKQHESFLDDMLNYFGGEDE